MLKVLRGLVLNPVLVAFARGLAEAAAMAGILFGIEFISGGNLPDNLQLLAPILLLVLRQAEGIADRIDPAKQRRREVLANSPETDSDGNPPA